MGALTYVDIPGYAGLILRRRLTDLETPGGILDMAHQWFTGTDAVFNRDTHTYTFGSGARLMFGYLDTVNDHHRYQGSAFQYIAFDELTQFDEAQYLYLFSRLRRTATGPLREVPLRMRAATNPGGPGHNWVKARFIEPWQLFHSGQGPPPVKAFHPAVIVDNPHLDADSYETSLEQLDVVTRAQLKDGDWDISPTGGLFTPEWFQPTSRDQIPDNVKRVRFWDLAATAATKGRDPDYTVGALLARDRATKQIYIEHIVRRRGTPFEIQTLIANTATHDRRSVTIGIEQEPGSAGKALIDTYKRNTLEGYTVKPVRPSGDKYTRAQPLASAAEAGIINIVTGPWNAPFLNEATLFPHSAHDDQIDAVVGAYTLLTARPDVDYSIKPISIEKDDPPGRYDHFK